MNSQLQERIKRDFPDTEWVGSASQYGVQCGTGWSLLVYAFFRDATAICTKSNSRLIVLQIKSKLGTLRLRCTQHDCTEIKSSERNDFLPETSSQIVSFRPYLTDPDLRAIIDHYEKASASRCEICGEMIHINTLAPINMTSLCQEHAALFIEPDYQGLERQLEEIDARISRTMLSRIDEISQ